MHIKSIEEIMERCLCVRPQTKDIIKVAEVNQRQFGALEECCAFPFSHINVRVCGRIFSAQLVWSLENLWLNSKSLRNRVICKSCSSSVSGLSALGDLLNASWIAAIPKLESILVYRASTSMVNKKVSKGTARDLNLVTKSYMSFI